VSKFPDWIKHYQVLTFYLLVFGISWPAMILVFYVFPQNAGMQALFGLTATFSPVLVALMISAIAKPAPKQGKKAPRWIAFVSAWIISWLVLSLHSWQVRGIEPELQVIVPTGLVALLPAWLLSCAFSRMPGVRELFGTLLRPMGHILWYMAALLTVPAVQLAGAGITIIVGGEVSTGLNGMPFFGAFVLIGLTLLEGFLVSGGINEESGWRGFVLPRLQARFPVIVAIAIVWFFWALWHIPYDIGAGTPLESILVNRILLNFVWAVLFAWVYNRTNGSLLAPALFHSSMNTFGNTLPRTDAATVLFVILVLAVIFYDRMWKKLPGDSLAVHS